MYGDEQKGEKRLQDGHVSALPRDITTTERESCVPLSVGPAHERDEAVQ